MMVRLESSPSPTPLSQSPLPFLLSPVSALPLQLIFVCYFISNTIAILNQVQSTSSLVSSITRIGSRHKRKRSNEDREYPKSDRSEYYFNVYVNLDGNRNGKRNQRQHEYEHEDLNEIPGSGDSHSNYAHTQAHALESSPSYFAPNRIGYYGKFYGRRPVRFYLSSLPLHKYQIAEEIIPGNLHSLEHSNYNRNHRLILIVHGFLSNATYPKGEVDRLRQAYFETKTDANIIGVDYSPLANPPVPRNSYSGLHYIQAIRNIPIVSTAIINFILFLLQTGYLTSLDQVQIIGFSLGAHVAGHAGRNMYRRTGQKIGRITGLDPAGVLFYFRSRDTMLDASDAKFVDVTHSAQGFYGFYGKLGHVDYFINGGGPYQPGCVELTRPSTIIGSCSHSRAYWYYAESIKNPHIRACRCKFCYLKGVQSKTRRWKWPGGQCQSPVVYGQHVDQRVRGNFYVQMQVKST